MCGLCTPTWVGAAPCLGPPAVRFQRRCISRGVFMSKELVISATSHERRVAILEEGQLVEIYIEREKEFALVGSIYKGKVTRVLPGMQSAFVDIGLDGDAFLYVSDVFENLEDYDHGQPHEHSQGAPAPQSPAQPIELLPGEKLGHAEHVIAPDTRMGIERALDASEAAQEVEQRPDLALTASETPTAEAHSIEADHREEAQAGPEERQPESNASAPQSFTPRFNPTQNYPHRSGNDRNDRQGQNYGGGRDRGRGGRWGRRGGRHRGGRQQGGPGGQNLPPSKYASPQGGEYRGYD